MKVIVSKEYGFCHGVRIALDKLDAAIEANPGRKIFSIGEIIHNQDIICEYKKKGVIIKDSIFGIGSGVGVVRAHGLPHSVIDDAVRKGFNVIDATCVYVRNISKIIKKEIDNKVPVFFVGEPEHPEVIASTQDFSKNVTIIGHNSFNPDKFAFPKEKCALISQTTMSLKRFLEISDHFIRHCESVHIHNTICPSTRRRQSSALETAGKVERMIILGGKNSSNTKRLFELCSEIVSSFHIERISELDRNLLMGVKTIGVTAGASTPDGIVDEAVMELENI